MINIDNIDDGGQGRSVSALEGVVFGETRLSKVDGAAGKLTIAGYRLEDLAPHVEFEHVVHLLEHDRLPDAADLEALRCELSGIRELPGTTLALLREAAVQDADPMDALRLGVAALSIERPSAHRLVAVLPTIAAAYARLRAGEDPVAPDMHLDHAANYLYMLRGQPPAAAHVRALHTYLCTVADHGMNASTFTARVIASTGSDLGSAIEGALGALKGPLHGGAPGPALEALLRLRAQGGSIDAATRAWVRDQIAAGERIMGFGHAVYRVRDPRADVLSAAAVELLAGSGLHEDALTHERAVLDTLHELKPGRTIATNVEFYTALLLHGLALPPPMFTPTFAIGRVAGWVAHVAEQRATGRLIRPGVAYVGAQGRSRRA
jgi:citrate synthase